MLYSCHAHLANVLANTSYLQKRTKTMSWKSLKCSIEMRGIGEFSVGFSLQAASLANSHVCSSLYKNTDKWSFKETCSYNTALLNSVSNVLMIEASSLFNSIFYWASTFYMEPCATTLTCKVTANNQLFIKVLTCFLIQKTFLA